LRRATLALVHSTAEHCTPVWFRSAHTCLIYSVINDLGTVTGCLRPTPADNLPNLADIQPDELRREGARVSLTHRPMEPGHLLHSALTCSSSANARNLKSRHPFVPAAQQLSSFDDHNRSAAHWADQHGLRTSVRRSCSCLHKWNMDDFATCDSAQKIKPLTMLFSNVQSIDLPVICTA